MNRMTIANAEYIIDDITGENISITATIDGVILSFPLDPNNRHYKEILRQVEEGTLTIADAEPVGEE